MTSANLLTRVRTLLNEEQVSGTGAVLQVVFRAGGTGYSVGDRLTLAGGGGNAIVEVMTVGSGIVTSVAILVQGTGYIIATGIATTASPSSGRSGCTIDILDVTTATFFKDSEIYQALTDGQNILAGLALSIFKAKQSSLSNKDVQIPYVLQPLYAVKTGTVTSGASAITLNPVVLDLISLKYNSSAGTPLSPVRFRNIGSTNIFQQDNTYLANVSTTYYASFSLNSVITLETASTNNAAAYSAEVISQPVDIDASNNPSLPENTCDIIAYFACSQLLAKDQRTEESMNAFKTFLQLSQQLVGI